MIDRFGGRPEMSDAKLFAHSKRHVFHDVTVVVRQLRKARINSPVEDVALKQFDYFFRCVDAHRLFDHCKDVVNEDRERGDMVYVRMCDDNVAYVGALLVCDGEREASCIKRDAIINQKGR